MNPVHLSPRLEAVANYVPQEAYLADIGSDHAYLPAHLLVGRQIKYALAGEVAVGPLANVQSEIIQQNLQGQLIARLANGLDAVQTSDQINTVVIAGMGGLLIRDILDRDWQKNGQRQFQTLILQPNTEEAAVRRWLINHQYQVKAEKIVQEGKHFYEIIVAQPGFQELGIFDLQFGPFLRRQAGPVFSAKWLAELQRINLILDRLVAAQKGESVTYKEWQAQKNKIQEVLK
ncbi:tRNA (adenine(22)-N(1))-methyltransferase [Convivina intestini]|uniref:tRNA (Adenine22-N1)-methyltransferase n=1 Tax=Convivina intestini TaxID=1505726 RepID=A0A2U1DEU8_9LACO|nr:class I SAM-dependent methyltransferase [Convivina intestini]PVY86201.1 tRNA (adenine22-N1)-methyltransferase [Convivina intestini]CAH1851370.1 tRNA (adenine(22)-N(1))-methyltransferase [Convivina intestini]CAH1852798.1 tRNA (adenine(22)-N(1))-methyltransferase [Convivina intestini]SDB81450.1 tRNA (adenine22-N1)-methyltransferase [Leuconostocaceae bacterium R-53105]